MLTRFTTEEVGQKYDEFARRYALMERFQEPLGVRRLSTGCSGAGSG
jgi:hypothetical protein